MAGMKSTIGNCHRAQKTRGVQKQRALQSSHICHEYAHLLLNEASQIMSCLARTDEQKKNTAKTPGETFPNNPWSNLSEITGQVDFTTPLERPKNCILSNYFVPEERTRISFGDPNLLMHRSKYTAYISNGI